MTLSGVRSSWATSAISCRRSASCDCSRADHRVERPRVRPEKRRTALDDAHRVFAVRDAIGRADEIACRNTDSPHQADEGQRDADKRREAARATATTAGHVPPVARSAGAARLSSRRRRSA